MRQFASKQFPALWRLGSPKKPSGLYQGTSRPNGRTPFAALENRCRPACKLSALPTACCHYPRCTSPVRVFRNRSERQARIETEIGQTRNCCHFRLSDRVSARTSRTHRPELLSHHGGGPSHEQSGSYSWPVRLEEIAIGLLQPRLQIVCGLLSIHARFARFDGSTHLSRIEPVEIHRVTDDSHGGIQINNPILARALCK